MTFKCERKIKILEHVGCKICARKLLKLDRIPETHPTAWGLIKNSNKKIFWPVHERCWAFTVNNRKKVFMEFSDQNSLLFSKNKK